MWKNISECPDHTKGVFGYWDQFGRFQFNTMMKEEAIKYGYDLWLDFVPPEKIKDE